MFLMFSASTYDLPLLFQGVDIQNACCCSDEIHFRQTGEYGWFVNQHSSFLNSGYDYMQNKNLIIIWLLEFSDYGTEILTA